MNRLAVIHNPRSKRNRSRAGRRPRAWALSDILYAEPETPEALVHALRDFAGRGVDLLAVEGGDGTVREVLTALPKAFEDVRPTLAILPSGNANLIAADVGVGAYGEHALARLAEDARAGRLRHRVRRRFPLEVHWADQSRDPITGMFFGAAAFTEATALAQETHRFGANHGLDVVVTLAAALGDVLSEERRQRWLAGRPIGLGVDGRPPQVQGRSLFLATTLHQLILGIWPFWGEGSGPVRYLDIPENPDRLHAAALPILRGEPTPWMLDAGYRSGMADELRLRLEDPFIVDGERFDPPAGGGELILRPGTALDFIGR